MNKQKRIEIFKRWQAQNPNPTTELKYKSHFQLLVAVILSAQATDISVNKATVSLFKDAPTPDKMLQLGVAGLKTYIKSIGLFNTKAENVIKTCRQLVEQHSSKVPKTRIALEALPGVGRKTANVVLNTAFKVPTIAVDTHIFRVSNRTGIAKGGNPLTVEQALLKHVPESYRLDAHHWLILHGRYICTARRPKCFDCLINDLCEYPAKTILKSESNHG